MGFEFMEIKNITKFQPQNSIVDINLVGDFKGLSTTPVGFTRHDQQNTMFLVCMNSIYHLIKNIFLIYNVYT